MHARKDRHMGAREELWQWLAGWDRPPRMDFDDHMNDYRDQIGHMLAERLRGYGHDEAADIIDPYLNGAT